MGERIRQGNWRPDPSGATEGSAVASSITEMVGYAKSKGVGLLAYVYPCLKFEQHAEAYANGALDLAADGVAAWLAQMLEDFVKATGAAGFAWDHDIFSPEGGGRKPGAYGQWKARACHPSFPL